jgi:hypothetical protein
MFSVQLREELCGRNYKFYANVHAKTYFYEYLFSIYALM